MIISEYPKYEKEFIFEDGEKSLNAIIEFIRIFRNTKAELNIGKEFKIYLSKPNDYTLISKILKWEDKILKEPAEGNYTIIEYQNYQIYLYNEHKETEEEKEKKQKTIESLEKSIAKRECLLNNQNFVQKAPENLVEEEKRKLAEEKETLKKLKN